MGIAARVIALSGASALQPKPSRISSTTGRADGAIAAGAAAVAGAGGASVAIDLRRVVEAQSRGGAFLER